MLSARRPSNPQCQRHPINQTTSTQAAQAASQRWFFRLLGSSADGRPSRWPVRRCTLSSCCEGRMAACTASATGKQLLALGQHQLAHLLADLPAVQVTPIEVDAAHAA